MKLFDTLLALHRRRFPCGVCTFWQDGLDAWLGIFAHDKELESFALYAPHKAADWLKQKAWEHANIDISGGYSSSSAQLFSVVRQLHNNEVNCGLQVGTGKTIQVWLGDMYNGIAESGEVASFEEAAQWLREHTKKYYAIPDLLSSAP